MFNSSCASSAYHGVQHYTDDNGATHLLIVTLSAPQVRLETVLASRNGTECNSVNHNGKDPAHANCAPPYPFEPVESMLARYTAQGAVAIINTDYFGPDGDHGAQGLAVKNGVRLDGPCHGVKNILARTTPSLAFSPTNACTIGIPETEETISQKLTTTYYNTVGGWPLIIKNGQIIKEPCDQISAGYDPIICNEPLRSAAGLTTDGRLILITACKTVREMAHYLAQNFSVQTALSFDGGRSASMAWVDGDGQIQKYYPRPNTRAVAEGLLVFSEKIR